MCMSVCLLADNALWNGLTRQQQWVHAAAKPNTKMSIVKYKQVIIDISLSTEEKTWKNKKSIQKSTSEHGTSLCFNKTIQSTNYNYVQNDFKNLC